MASGFFIALTVKKIIITDQLKATDLPIAIMKLPLTIGQDILSNYLSIKAHLTQINKHYGQFKTQLNHCIGE